MKAPTLRLQNTLSGQKEAFEPINPPFVGLYVCGLRHTMRCIWVTFEPSFPLMSSIDTCAYLGYKVRYVRNITDVGHLTDDSEKIE